MNRFFLFLTIVMLSVFLYSCDTGVDYHVKILTDIKQAPLWAELFMAEYPMERVELVFEENMEAYISQHKDIDLVITAKWLDESYFFPFPYKNNNIANEDSFYPGILKTRGNKEGIRFFPVSFDLPVFVAKKNGFDGYANDFYMDMDAVKKLAKDKTSVKRSKISNAVFYPVFSDTFIEDTIKIFDISFTNTGTGKILWDERKLKDFTDFISDWYKETKTEYSMAKAYKQKYLTLPPGQCILQDRAELLYMYLSDFFMIEKGLQSKLDFAFFEHDTKVAAGEKIIYAAVTMDSKNKDTAALFLKWLFSSNAQRNIMDYSKKQGLSDFGIAGGISSIVNIAEAQFPIVYRELAGRLPEPDRIVFYRQQEPAIKSFVQNRFLPWLDEILSKKSNRPLE